PLSGTRGSRVNLRRTAYAKPGLEHSSSVARLLNHARGKNLREDVLDRDVSRIIEDFSRRNIIVCEKQMPLDLFKSRTPLLEELPVDPAGAASRLIKKFVKSSKENPFSSVVTKLPLDVRNIRHLEGQAYFFEAGDLADRAVLVVRGHGPSRSRAEMFDRAHELGHFVHLECGIRSKDQAAEEEWCDNFADEFVSLSVKAKDLRRFD
ncbi:MAG: hypothetical protein AAFO51_03200, partial [Pseudomonadota bacterium]